MLEINKICTSDIEIAVAYYFNIRTNLIVPNISWGMFLHECDLLVLTKSGYAYEVEIKITKQDIVRDLKKKHGHESHKIKKLYFAIPEYLSEYIDFIPTHAGIFLINKSPYHYICQCRKIREARSNNNYKFNDREKFNLARLGAMRIWKFKRQIIEDKQKQQLKLELS